MSPPGEKLAKTLFLGKITTIEEEDGSELYRLSLRTSKGEDVQIRVRIESSGEEIKALFVRGEPVTVVFRSTQATLDIEAQT